MSLLYEQLFVANPFFFSFSQKFFEWKKEFYPEVAPPKELSLENNTAINFI